VSIKENVKELVRPLPGVRRMSLFRQQLAFRGSSQFWERHYARGETSGAGSYGHAAQAKAEFLNAFVHQNTIQSVVEFGCGDGNQLSLAEYPRYVGLDVSRTAIGLCRRRFAADLTKSFFLYDGTCFTDHGRVFAADLAISLDVIYHLIEDQIFETYMTHLFDAGQRSIVIYSTNSEVGDDAPHVRHRIFTTWVERNCPQWELTEVTRGPNEESAGRADFFTYKRVGYVS
jgi:cyclopropane fatty-acyl-phospholipid synthase-like methyltransferase